MKLIRFAILSLEPFPDDFKFPEMHLSSVAVETQLIKINDKNEDSKVPVVLMIAKVKLSEDLQTTELGHIIIPEGARKQAEAAIENLADLISVAENCKRSITSPFPCLAFEPESKESRNWLGQTKGVLRKHDPLPAIQFQFDITDKTIFESILDRLDGVQLLAEAISSNEPISKYRELIRFFERAFQRNLEGVREQLSKFLEKGCLEYDRKEVNRWLKYRQPAIHAKRMEKSTVSSDVRPFIPRMEQAAYDVLFNKAEWHSKSPERRNVWSQPVQMFQNYIGLERGSAFKPRVQFLDIFHAYPHNLHCVINDLPDPLWIKFDSLDSALSGKLANLEYPIKVFEKHSLTGGDQKVIEDFK